ncbi:hypothetical protein TNCV_2972391 [Trichonephila clavipes]|nr:hypothetical protein TNCV_2972391 [Trichonephila clavipes]
MSLSLVPLKTHYVETPMRRKFVEARCPSFDVVLGDYHNIVVRHGCYRFSASRKSTDLGRGRTCKLGRTIPASNQLNYPVNYEMLLQAQTIAFRLCMEIAITLALERAPTFHHMVLILYSRDPSDRWILLQPRSTSRM